MWLEDFSFRVHLVFRCFFFYLSEHWDLFCCFSFFWWLVWRDGRQQDGKSFWSARLRARPARSLHGDAAVQRLEENISPPLHRLYLFKSFPHTSLWNLNPRGFLFHSKRDRFPFSSFSCHLFGRENIYQHKIYERSKSVFVVFSLLNQFSIMCVGDVLFKFLLPLMHLLFHFLQISNILNKELS